MARGRKPSTEPKEKKAYDFDPLRKAVRSYQTKMEKEIRQVENSALYGTPVVGTKLSYKEDVVTPILNNLKGKLPEYDLVTPKDVDVIGKSGYYKIMAGETVLGGLSYPGREKKCIHFTIFAYGKPWGRFIEVNSLGQLVGLVRDIADLLEIPKKA